MRRYQEALDMHFDKALVRINQTVEDPMERLVHRSSVAKLRAEWLTPRKFFEPGLILFAALGDVSKLVFHPGPSAIASVDGR
jgi:hypothetical protein